MKSEWKVTSTWIGDKKMYAAYRLLDRDAIDHSGNREVLKYVDTHEAAKSLADELNLERII